jgi:phospholipid/cholesterol/gamma-HCH transport system permease protein
MVEAIGAWLSQRIRTFLYATGFFYRVVVESLRFLRRNRVGMRVLVLQIYFTGVQALGIITLIALAIGAVIIIQGSSLLPRFGESSLIYTILITVITRELGPILTAFILIARSSTAIATELGSMVVSHQIEAYVAVGVNPISYIVVPRFLGAVISMVVLTVYFNISGLIGSYFVAQLLAPLALVEYLRKLIAAFHTVDIVSSVLKSFVVGAIVGSVATYQGFNVKVASTEVPVVAIKAVGQGFVLCILADALITLVYYI